ncbi:unnamed protein product [Periconia digitata]|uniref:Ricin B lectin domain-containing protein n=1 Tax=Periconia digitata TaxID=1303443 RepID=A0A9W4XLN4_9PLEO|nr:unnamed protein product [Periconia digitata]
MRATTAQKRFMALILLAAPQISSAISAGDPDTIFQSFNNALLIRSGSDVYYKTSLNNDTPDPSWSGALNILVAEDAYERTGDAAQRPLVNELCTTWLKKNPPPWTWNWWNDDLGWYTMALTRGYLITGTQSFLDQAKYGFDLAFTRGWDTQYNGGGIWEENPEGTVGDGNKLSKEALANDSLGKVACLLYQATHDRGYLDKCQQIYGWVTTHIYDADTGQIYTGVEPDGKLNKAAAAYNQGTFLDFTETLYMCKGNTSVRAIGQKALDYLKTNIAKNGVLSGNNDHTWADEAARGAGNYIRNHQLWDKYYDWMVQNADAIMKNRRSDLGITDNAWDRQTPNDNTALANKFDSATAWLQYTPTTKPGSIAGLHYVVNQKTGLLLDNGNKDTKDAVAMQWGRNGGQNQRWHFSQNADGSWNIISMSSFNALDCPAGKPGNGVQMVQWPRNRNSNQRWLLEQQSDGAWQIKNQASGGSLDGASNSTNGAPVVQWTWGAESQQKWLLQPV